MMREIGRCQAQGCGTRHYARGLCKKHYTQMARYGRLTPEREKGRPRTCAAPGCDRRDVIGTYCRRHARQVRVHGRLTPELEHRMGNAGCKVPGCARKHRAKGYCLVHYNQARWRQIRLALDPIGNGPGNGAGR